jgi:hypothetical protein
MPKKLKDLKVTKVDFVDAGANQEANIRLYKSQTPPDGKPESTFKRFLTAVAKAIGFDDQDSLFEELELEKARDAETFNDKMNEAARRKITSEIWEVCYALEESLCSVILDDEIPWESKPETMAQNLSQFSAAMSEFIPKWASGQLAEKVIKPDAPVTAERIALAEDARTALDAFIAKNKESEGQTDPLSKGSAKQSNPQKMKGDLENMNFDKSKLTPEELATLEAIEKKAGIPEETPPAEPGKGEVAKGATAEPPATELTPEGDDIYKGLHPAVKTELENLRKFRETAEDRELNDVAKKYEIIGKKAEELVPVLKNLKAAGGDAYDQMLAILDASVDAFEKSGLFSEIGKHGAAGSVEPWAMIEKHADDIMKAAPTITRTQAIEKACEQHPELVADYEDDR